jgi:hypothetical protein
VVPGTNRTPSAYRVRCHAVRPPWS